MSSLQEPDVKNIHLKSSTVGPKNFAVASLILKSHRLHQGLEHRRFL